MGAPITDPHKANIGMGMITNPTKTRDPIAWLCNHDVIKNETNAGIKPVTANQQPATSRTKIVGFALIRDGCTSLTLILAVVPE